IFQKTGNGVAKNLAFSEIPRLRYKYSPYDLIPNGLKSCETIEDACMACQIFGMIGNNKEETKEEDKDKSSLRGRVFFKDATIPVKKADIQSEPKLIKSLGEPHPTLTGFYLDKGTYDNNTSKIRGRKFYWHHKDKIDKDYPKFKTSITPEGQEKHNSSIQFMNSGNVFEFEVSFKDLQEEELGLLLLTLELEPGMLHKFGKAKGLGFGSSEVKVEKLLLNSKDRYSSFDSMYEEFDMKELFIDSFKTKFDFENKESWKDLKIIMNETNKCNFTQSPFPEREEKGKKNTLNWFMHMKSEHKDDFKLPKIQDYK
ncbi:MAG: TIGR03986 family type III CRISPR-associated RAMP protein, partial [Fusobacteriaceae bacterium]